MFNNLFSLLSQRSDLPSNSEAVSPPTAKRSILIANRGEIASRIIRTCKKMGIKSIVVFSDADRGALFVSQADVAVYIGESTPSESYLNVEKIITAAKKTKATAIHPGYGFLSENVGFARRCEAEGILFIGPRPEAIEAMGSKSMAKSLMQQHNVPVVPGYQGEDQSNQRLTKEAEKIGFPVLLKATAGGGGKGMRIVQKSKELSKAIEAARREAKLSFGDDELIIEKYITAGRHIEFQIFGDKHGNIIHLLERECTIQRRYQKVIEESPSHIMDESLREKMSAAAINAAKAINYDNAGTVEFIYDEESKQFYFLEVNTRLQVEHPVTEEITGLDLVQLQIEVAMGIPLSITQEEVKGMGYAIEVRLYAEDPSNNFLPITGTIKRFDYPEVDGLRVETSIENGSKISVYYDPMIAKLIVWDHTRQGAHQKMQYVLRNLVCLGITTNQRFLLHLLEHEEFQKGNYNTHFIAHKINLTEIATIEKNHVSLGVIAACLKGWNERQQQRGILKSVPSGWRSSFYQHQQETYFHKDNEVIIRYRYKEGSFQFFVEDQEYQVQLVSVNNGALRIEIDRLQHQFTIAQNGNSFYLQNEETGNLYLTLKDRFPEREKEKIKGGYLAPMPSQVIKVLVSPDQKVQAGDGLVVLSSMKMENTICSEEDGVVDEVYASEGTNVEAGFLLIKLTNKKLS